MAKDYDKLKAKAKELYEQSGSSARYIAEQLSIHHSTVLSWAKEDKWIKGASSDEIPEFIPKEEVQKKRIEATNKSLRQQNERLIRDYSELMDKYDIALSLKDNTPVKIPVINMGQSGKGEAVPLVQYSDWHVEERVEKKTVRGLNEYSPEIARVRAKKLTENTLKLVKKERQDVTIKSLFLNLGGDFINSYLHEHDVQMNYMAPIEALAFAKELLKESILTLAAYGDFRQIDIVCTRGNHPRLTKRMQSSNDYKMNLEAILYNMLKQEITDSSIRWHIPESELGYVSIGGKMIRCLHGHQIKFQGGVGGLTIPMNKYIMNLDKTEKADYNCISHWHQMSMPTKSCSVNGSLVGFNSYALSCGFTFEQPQQVFQLLDSKRGLTVRTPIFCE